MGLSFIISWWKERRSLTKAPRARLLQRGSGDGTGESRLTERAECRGWRRLLKDHVQKGGKGLSGHITVTSSSLTSDHNPPSLKGPATTRDNSAAISLSDSPPLFLNLLTCPAYHRGWTGEKDSERWWGVWWANALSALPQKRCPWPSREEQQHLAAPAGSQREHPTAACVKNPATEEHKVTNYVTVPPFGLFPKWSCRPRLSGETAVSEMTGNPTAPETGLLWCRLCSHPGFLPAEREPALPPKGTEMFVLHWHLLTAVL